MHEFRILNFRVFSRFGIFPQPQDSWTLTGISANGTQTLKIASVSNILLRNLASSHAPARVRAGRAVGLESWRVVALATPRQLPTRE